MAAFKFKDLQIYSQAAPVNEVINWSVLYISLAAVRFPRDVLLWILPFLLHFYIKFITLLRMEAAQFQFFLNEKQKVATVCQYQATHIQLYVNIIFAYYRHTIF